MMKKILLILLFLLNASVAHSVNWCDDSAAIGCWTMETGSGVVLVDQTQYSNDGDFEGTGEPAWKNDDLPDAGDGFDGTTTYALDFSSDRIRVPDSASLDNSGDEMVYVGWIRLDADETGGNAWIIEKTIDNAEAFRSMFLSATNEFRFRVFTSAGVVNVDTASISWTAATWHHIACRYDGATMYIYWDGVENNTGSHSGNLTTNNDPVSFGEDAPGGSLYPGYMDEFALFDADKSVTDINDMLTNGLVQAAGGNAVSDVPYFYGNEKFYGNVKIY